MSSEVPPRAPASRAASAGSPRSAPSSSPSSRSPGSSSAAATTATSTASSSRPAASSSRTTRSSSAAARRLRRHDRAQRRRPGRGRHHRRASSCTRAPARSSAPPRSPASPTATSRSPRAPTTPRPSTAARMITQVDTTTPVDLDQLFNALRAPERKGLQDIIQGSATVYAGRGEEANETYRYLSPALTATDKLIPEINRDSAGPHRLPGQRRPRHRRRRRAPRRPRRPRLQRQPGPRRRRRAQNDEPRPRPRGSAAGPPPGQHHLLQPPPDPRRPRPARRDVAQADTKDLDPFLRQFDRVVDKSVPVFKDLRIAVNKKGKNNDLTDATGKLVPLQKAADRASGPTVQAMIDSEPVFTFLRPYSPDLLNAVGKLGQITANYDANGHYVRVQPAGLGIFRYNGGARPTSIRLRHQRAVRPPTAPLRGRHQLQASTTAVPARRPSPPRRLEPVPGQRRPDQPRPARPQRLHGHRRAPRTMRRALVIALSLIAVGAVVLIPSATGADDGPYKVRAHLRQRRLRRQRRGGPRRRRHRRHRRVGRRHRTTTRSPASRAAPTPSPARPSSS